MLKTTYSFYKYIDWLVLLYFNYVMKPFLTEGQTSSDLMTVLTSSFYCTYKNEMT